MLDRDESVPIVDPPVGSLCIRCDEPIAADDQGMLTNVLSLDGSVVERAQHRECFIGSVSGSVAHLEKRCGCFVAGSECGDDSTKSKRQAARDATKLFESLLKLGRYP